MLIREAGPPGWLRVTMGTAAEMAAFRAALTAVLERPGRCGRPGRRPVSLVIMGGTGCRPFRAVTAG